MSEQPEPRRYPLEPPAGEMRAMTAAAAEMIVRFIESRPDAPAADEVRAAALLPDLREPAPAEGRAFEDLLARFEDAALAAIDTAGPGYLAYIPGGGLFAAAVADFLACGTNRFVNMWSLAPALVQMEWAAIGWLRDLFDFPPEARGILTSGGSMANLSAVVAARRSRLGEDFGDGTLYVSDQTHASLTKTAMIAGFPRRAVRVVPTTPALRVDLDELIRMIREDRDAGRRPFLIVGNAGTTNTGAIDPLDDLAEMARAEGMWLHVDAAYGGPFQMTERGRAAFRGVERADSITLDPHKAMFLPYGTGCLLVRDGPALRLAHQVEAEYLQDLAPEGEVPNFTDYSPELSRDFRGLRLWLPIQLHGIDAFRDALDEKLDLTRHLYDALAATPGFELPWEPELTVVPFRYLPPAGDADAFNRRLLERINASRRVFLSSTMIGGRFVIRACIVSHRTHRDRIDEAIDIVRRAAVEVAAG